MDFFNVGTSQGQKESACPSTLTLGLGLPRHASRKIQSTEDHDSIHVPTVENSHQNCSKIEVAATVKEVIDPGCHRLATCCLAGQRPTALPSTRYSPELTSRWPSSSKPTQEPGPAQTLARDRSIVIGTSLPETLQSKRLGHCNHKVMRPTNGY